MTALVEAKNVYRYYGRHCAVEDVSFTLGQGEVLGFLGPNGAGKTTTMQMLSGNLAASAGTITVNGVDILEQPKSAKRTLGYLPDTPPLYKELTVQEFLNYCAKLHGIEKHGIKKRLGLIGERCGLSEVYGRLIGQLSKGFQQRVGIAQAILHNPDVIILDEPTIGLDPIQIREIRALIRELGRDHGVILSTHLLNEVQESCTHVQIIHNGRLILRESVEDLNRQMTTCILDVCTRLIPDTNLLLEIPGVDSVEQLADNKLRIHHKANCDPAKQIAETLVTGGFGLEELMPVKKSMEDIFITLTQASAKDEK
ncbi:MAG: ATP-binding cassette domain-containing protein [Gammaproteobacteria bacterium]